MCGIIGYIGKKDATPILVDGLKRLEYRGYDSAGIAVVDGGRIRTEKVVGKIAALEESLKGVTIPGQVGIAHTRWATHGSPSLENAHPHTDTHRRIAVVHNGIIENFSTLRRRLESEGHVFSTQTDTEVLAHLIAKFHNGNLETAVQKALRMVQGTYGVAVISSNEPRKIVGARNGSQLVVGIGDGEYFVASDVAAILDHTRQVVYLDDQEMAVLTDDGVTTTTIRNVAVTKSVEEVPWDMTLAQKDGFDHFMLKEIFEQPRSIADCMRGRLIADEGRAHLGGLNISDDDLARVKRIIITACGTSWHAGLIGEYLIEELARIPVEVEYASEFRYRDPIIENDTLVIVISQSGETADALAAMREAQRRGAKALGICNVVGSTIARECDGGIYIHAGPEIGVASTKAFTSQIVALAVLAIKLGRLGHMTSDVARELISAMLRLPEQIEQILELRGPIKDIALEYCSHNNFLYLGRGYNYPVALEGALKLKEISYIHAEGYPAAEMKHGPIALIDKSMPVVVIAIRDSAYEKIMGNIEEVIAREGRVIALASEGDKELERRAEHVIWVPETLASLTPVLTVLPLQLLAYDIAVRRGCDVDQPRNLAKSVTVE